jgi:Tfp pilus assembly protein PilF
MPTPFLSSEEYDERAHQLYNEGQYDEALDILREGLALYPNAVELHIGVGYARLAREEYAWARRGFEEALILEPEHEDALAGLGETLLKFGQYENALRSFRRILELGYSDDLDLMLQVGRALFREDSPRYPLMTHAREFFEVAVQQAPDMAEAAACLGYAQHRVGDDDAAIASLRRALQLDGDHTEARIYLANIFYDRQEFEKALYHLERTTPEDHWDELGIWRLLELKKSLYGVGEDDPDLKPWDERLSDLSGDPDDIDEMLGEIESRVTERETGSARNQLELFGVLLSDLVEQRRETTAHRVVTQEGRELEGSWEEIVTLMRDSDGATKGRSLEEFMRSAARRSFSVTGVKIPTSDAESFIRGSADAGLLRIVR